MKNALVFVAVFMAICSTSGPSHAITIVLKRAEEGTRLNGTSYLAQRPLSSCMLPSGAANPARVVRAAADYWETIYTLPYTITIEWGFTDLPSDTVAGAAVTRVQQSGSGRGLIQAGTIAINRKPEGCLYVDPRPDTWSEFPLSGLVTSTSIPYPGRRGKFIEDQRYTTIPSYDGDTAGYDLYSAMIHEIGHLLGMAGDVYEAEVRDGDIDVRTWHVIPGVSWMSSGGHLTYPGISRAAMSPRLEKGSRKWPSQADISTISQISGWWTTSWGTGGGGVRGVAAGNPLNE